jgi:RNA recognition motif-containing protein
MSVKLYVGNLSYTTGTQDLLELFSTIGSVKTCTIVEDRTTRRSRGFGFVEMLSKAEGENAVAQLDGKEIAGRPLRVSKAKTGEELSRSIEPSFTVGGPFVDYSTRAYFKEPVEGFGW